MVSEQRVPQSSDDSSSRNAKIDIDKEVRIKNKLVSSYGNVDSQMVSDPIGKILNLSWSFMQ